MDCEIRQMRYGGEKGILTHGTYGGLEFAIVSMGSHPCAYIGLPEGHRLNGRREASKAFAGLPVHGGITYSQPGLGLVGLMEDKWVIGWDYGHYGDYMRFTVDEMPGKEWTTEEILAEVRKVIDEINRRNER